MCGRARQALAPEDVAVAAGVAQQRWVDRERYRPSHNAAPGAWMPVVRVGQDGQRTLQTMRWGLVPSFHKATEKPDHYRMFNARCETVDSKGIFKRLLGHKRCVVPLQGFYEWKADAGGKKQPYYVSLSGDKPMLMAGLFDAYTDEEGQKVHTYTLLTTDCSKRLEWLHDRMPVILQNEEEAAAWLGESALPGGAAKDGAEAAAEKGDHETAKDAGSAEQAPKADAEPPCEEAQHEDERSKEEYAAAIAKGTQLVNKLARPYNHEDLVWWPVTAAMGKMSYQGDDAWKDMRTAKGAISNFFKPTGVVKSSKGKGGAAGAAGVAGEGGAAGSKAGAADAASAAAQAGVGETAGTAGTAGQGRAADAKAAAGTGNQEAAATASGSQQEQQQQTAAGDAVRNTDDTNAARESGDEATEDAKPKPAAEAGAEQKAVGTGRTRAAGKVKTAGKAEAAEKAEASGSAGEGAAAGKGAAGGRKRAASAAAVAKKGAATAAAPRKRAKRA